MATRAQIRRQILRLREQIKELRAAGRNQEATRLRAQINALLEQRDSADQQPSGFVADYERRWAAMLTSYFDAMRSGNEAAAQAAVNEYRALRDEIYAAWREAIAADRERYEASLDPAVFAANEAAGVGTPHPFDVGWTPDPNIATLQTMFQNASAFLMTMAGASQTGNWQAEPGQVIDTDAEKLLGWGATQEQAAAWDRYQDLIDSGVAEAQALAQAGLTAQQVSEYSIITAWSPDQWAQNYHDILSGNRVDELPARYGPEQLSGNLFTVDEQGNPITPTYGGAGLGSVPGTMGTWSSIYGDAGGEAAWQRLSSDAYTLMGGWASGYRPSRGTGVAREGSKPRPGDRTAPTGEWQRTPLGEMDPFSPAAAGLPGTVEDLTRPGATTPPGEALPSPVTGTYPEGGQPGPVTPTTDTGVIGTQAGFTTSPLASGSPTTGVLSSLRGTLQDYLEAQSAAMTAFRAEQEQGRAAASQLTAAESAREAWANQWRSWTIDQKNAYSYGGLTGVAAYQLRREEMTRQITTLQQLVATERGERSLARTALTEARATTADWRETMSETSQDYLARARYMVPYLPENLVRMFAQFWVDTGDYNQALAALRQTPQYNQFFPGIRRPDGTLRLSETEYLGTVAAYIDVLGEFGIASGWLQARVPELIIGEVSPEEFRSRVGAMDERIMAQGDTLRRIYSEFYGVDGMTDQALLAAAIDPTVRQGLLNRQITIAEIGGEAARSGFEIGVGLSTRMYQAEIGLGRATELFQTAARVLPTMGRASGRQWEGQFGLGSFLGAEAFGEAPEQERIQRILAGEAANFTPQELAARNEYALTGLRPR